MRLQDEQIEIDIEALTAIEGRLRRDYPPDVPAHEDLAREVKYVKESLEEALKRRLLKAYYDRPRATAP